MKRTIQLVIFSLLFSNALHAQWFRDYSLCYNPEGMIYDSAKYYYTAETLDSIVHFQLDKSSTFYPAIRYEYTYDENGNALSTTIYNLSVGGIENVSRETYTYNNGLQIELTSQVLIDGNWVNYYRILYSYDSNQILEQENAENWIPDNWEPAYQIVYANDANGHVSSIQSYYYMETWYEEFSSTYTYLDGNLILVESIDYEDNPIYMTEYTFDTDNNLVYVRYSTWASSYNTWLYNDTTYEYDSNGNLIHEESGYLNYTGGGTTYFETGSCDHFYFLLNHIQNAFEIPGFSAYPNPGHNLISISTAYESASLEIFDSQGKRIRTESIRKGINHIPVEDIAAGMYLIRLKLDNTIQTMRWMKL